MKRLFILMFIVVCTPLYAQDDFIGTHLHPIPLKGKHNQKLNDVKVYFFDDSTYEIQDNDSLIFSGQFYNNENTVEFGGKPAFANKVFISLNGKETVCLQTVFYQPEKYFYQTDIFCPI